MMSLERYRSEVTSVPTQRRKAESRSAVTVVKAMKSVTVSRV